MGRAFKIATMPIAPEDSNVEKLAVRRNLPFGKRVRGRLFVHSPRMSATIDVNEKGTALTR